MVYLDLDELPALVGRGRLLASRKWAARSFLRRDHLFEESRDIGEEVRTLIHDQTQRLSRGPIRLLTQLRYFGYFMSPLNLFYVFDDDDQQLEYIVAEVNNTPWKERHCYVLWDGNRAAGGQPLRFVHDKQFHVSPFMPMDCEYHWNLSVPEQRLKLHLANVRQSQEVFAAAMSLQRRELTRPQLRKMTLRYPMMTAQITGGIYTHALKLWWKKCPFYSHPK